MQIRPAAVAGQFYPAPPAVLQQTVDDLLASVPGVPVDGCRAVIVPHAGYVYSGSLAAVGLSACGAGRWRRVLLVGPSHHLAFEGLALSTAQAFATPLGLVAVDEAAAGRLLARFPNVVQRLDAAHQFEHALEVELPFMQRLWPEVPVLPLVVGAVDDQQLAQVLDAVWDDRTLLVVSSDLSHYLDDETARVRDARTARAIEHLQPDRIGPQDACGFLPVRALLRLARMRGYAVQRLALANSSDTLGPKDRVVGYGAWVMTAVGEGV